MSKCGQRGIRSNIARRAIHARAWKIPADRSVTLVHASPEWSLRLSPLISNRLHHRRCMPLVTAHTNNQTTTFTQRSRILWNRNKPKINQPIYDILLAPFLYHPPQWYNDWTRPTLIIGTTTACIFRRCKHFNGRSRIHVVVPSIVNVLTVTHQRRGHPICIGGPANRMYYRRHNRFRHNIHVSVDNMEGGVYCITAVDEPGQAFGEKITTIIEPPTRQGSVICNLYFISGTECP